MKKPPAAICSCANATAKRTKGSARQRNAATGVRLFKRIRGLQAEHGNASTSMTGRRASS
eukprot:3079409-Alexandrium_andersonii.AAC.1